MAIKPVLPKWIPDGNPSYITDPGEGKRAIGFIYHEEPPMQYFNWGLYNLSEWTKGLQGSFFDVVIGSAAQVSNNEATHDISQLNDALMVSGTKALILDGTHALIGNTTLTNNDIMMVSESPLAIIDSNTFILNIGGNRSLLKIRGQSFSPGNFIISGAGSELEGMDMDIQNMTVFGGAIAKTSGVSSGMIFSTATVGNNHILLADTPQKFKGQKNFESTVLAYGANIPWDLDVGQVAQITLTGATAILDNPSAMVNGGSYALRIIQDAIGGRDLTFGTAYKWVNGVAPILPSGPNQYMWISFLSNGTNMDGVGQGPFS